MVFLLAWLRFWLDGVALVVYTPFSIQEQVRVRARFVVVL